MANSDCTSFPVRYFINSQEASFFSSSLLSNITRHEPETVAPYSASSFTFINVLVPTVNLSPTFSRTDETLDDEEVKTATSPFTNWFVESHVAKKEYALHLIHSKKRGGILSILILRIMLLWLNMKTACVG